MDLRCLRLVVARFFFAILLLGASPYGVLSQSFDDNPDVAGKSVPCDEGIVCTYDQVGHVDRWTTEYDLTYTEIVGFFSKYIEVKEKVFTVSFSSIREQQEAYNQWAQEHGYSTVRDSGHLTRRTLLIPAFMSEYQLSLVWAKTPSQPSILGSEAGNEDFLKRCDSAVSTVQEYRQRINDYSECLTGPGESMVLSDCNDLVYTYIKCPKPYAFLNTSIKKQLDAIVAAESSINSYKRLANAPQSPDWIGGSYDSEDDGYGRDFHKTVEDDYIDPGQLPKDFLIRLKQAKARMDDAIASARRAVETAP